MGFLSFLNTKAQTINLELKNITYEVDTFIVEDKDGKRSEIVVGNFWAKLVINKDSVHINFSASDQDEINKGLQGFSNKLNWIKKNKKSILKKYNSTYANEINSKIRTISLSLNGEAKIYFDSDSKSPNQKLQITSNNQIETVKE